MHPGSRTSAPEPSCSALLSEASRVLKVITRHCLEPAPSVYRWRDRGLEVHLPPARARGAWWPSEDQGLHLLAFHAPLRSHGAANCLKSAWSHPVPSVSGFLSASLKFSCFSPDAPLKGQRIPQCDHGPLCLHLPLMRLDPPQ